MHIFEDLGEKVPMAEWDLNKVYEIIKLKLKEIHLLGIAHNDAQLANNAVSVSGKISLIYFGYQIIHVVKNLTQWLCRTRPHFPISC